MGADGAGDLSRSPIVLVLSDFDRGVRGGWAEGSEASNLGGIEPLMERLKERSLADEDAASGRVWRVSMGGQWPPQWAETGPREGAAGVVGRSFSFSQSFSFSRIYAQTGGCGADAKKEPGERRRIWALRPREGWDALVA